LRELLLTGDNAGMKTCPECGREYLDSYDECPFCAREPETGSAPGADVAAYGRRRLVAVTALVAIVVLAGVVLISAVASRVPAEESRSGLSPEQACFSNQARLEQRAALMQAETGTEIGDVAELQPDYVRVLPDCPDGGEYSISWTAQLPRVTCSVHGWHAQDE